MRDPDARCCVCDVRLTAKVDADHEDACIRKADGLTPFVDEPMHPAFKDPERCPYYPNCLCGWFGIVTPGCVQ